MRGRWEVFSSRVKERILSAAGYRSRFGLRRTGEGREVADDDHRSSYSTIVDGSPTDGKGRREGREGRTPLEPSRHCAILKRER